MGAHWVLADINSKYCLKAGSLHLHCHQAVSICMQMIPTLFQQIVFTFGIQLSGRNSCSQVLKVFSKASFEISKNHVSPTHSPMEVSN